MPELAGEIGGRRRLAGQHFRRQAAERALDDRLRAAAEIEREAFEPQFGRFGGIEGVQFAARGFEKAGREDAVGPPSGAKAEVEADALRFARCEIELRRQGAGERGMDLRQRPCLRKQRGNGGRVHPIGIERDAEFSARRGVSEARAQFRRTGVERKGQRHVAFDASRVALHRGIDMGGAPAPAGHLVVEKHRGVADADAVQRPEAVPLLRVGQHLLDQLQRHIRGRVVGRGADAEGDPALLMALQMHDRVFDRDLRRRQPAADQGAGAEARRHFREIGDRLAVRQRHADIFGPQMQFVGRTVEAEAHAGDRHAEAAGAGEGVLDIGHQPVELDRPLHQLPDAETGKQDQYAGDRAEPDQETVRVAADAQRRLAPGGATEVPVEARMQRMRAGTGHRLVALPPGDLPDHAAK